MIRRVHTGLHLAEGPAWSSLGQYAIFSDVKNDTLYRYIWETGEVTVFRRPSFTTNGNSFDFQGRQLSTQDFFRRVVRWEAGRFDDGAGRQLRWHAAQLAQRSCPA